MRSSGGHNHIVQAQATLLSLAKRNWTEDGSMEASLAAITEAVSREIHVPRAGVWLFTPDRSAIVAADLYETKLNGHSNTERLAAADYPAYFRALEENRTIPAFQAAVDPRTREYAGSYLERHGIISLVDAPVALDGETIGVLCCEETSGPRQWSEEEMLLAGSFADLTALAIGQWRRKALEDERTELVHRIYESQRLVSLGTFAASVAHDFNNLLNPINGWADYALKHPLTPEEVAEALRQIRNAAEKAKSIASQLMEYSRQNVTGRECTDAGAALRELSHLLQVTVPKNIALMLPPKHPAAQEPLMVRAGVVRFQQVVLNLVSNAVEAIGTHHPGRVKVALHRRPLDMGALRQRPETECLKPGSYVELTVLDTGPGITSDAMPKLFDRFFTTKQGGHGLGLPSVRDIAVSAGGTVWAESHPGVETIFHVLFPEAE